MVHDRVADHYGIDYLVAPGAGLRAQDAHQVVDLAHQTLVQQPRRVGRSVGVRDPGHDVLAINDLGVHRPGPGQSVPAGQVDQVRRELGRARVHRQAEQRLLRRSDADEVARCRRAGAARRLGPASAGLATGPNWTPATRSSTEVPGAPAAARPSSSRLVSARKSSSDGGARARSTAMTAGSSSKSTDRPSVCSRCGVLSDSGGISRRTAPTTLAWQARRHPWARSEPSNQVLSSSVSVPQHARRRLGPGTCRTCPGPRTPPPGARPRAGPPPGRSNLAPPAPAGRRVAGPR